jgi:hypothetical protein
MPEWHDGHVGLEVELQHREIGVRIATNDFGIGDASVGELRADQVRGASPNNSSMAFG